MCTSIALFECNCFGRNLDLDRGFGEKVVIMPRRFPLHFHHASNLDRHHAMIGMAAVVDDHPLYAEAMNEHGLYMAGLNFPGNAHYEDAVPEGNTALAPDELIPWILGTCQNIEEAKEKLQSISLARIPFTRHDGQTLPLAPLHWHIADQHGALVLETMECGNFLYEDPVGVLTNNPPFPFHQMNLNQYQHLSASPVQNKIAPALDLQRFGEIGKKGVLALMCDSTNAERKGFTMSERTVGKTFDNIFAEHKNTRIIIATFASNARCEDQEHSRVAQFFRLLDTVAMPRGSVITEQGREDITIYSCCMSKATQTYYCKTYESAGICAVSMRPEMMDDKQLHIYDLCQQWSPIFIPEQRA